MRGESTAGHPGRVPGAVAWTKAHNRPSSSTARHSAAAGDRGPNRGVQGRSCLRGARRRADTNQHALGGSGIEADEGLVEQQTARRGVALKRSDQGGATGRPGQQRTIRTSLQPPAHFRLCAAPWPIACGAPSRKSEHTPPSARREIRLSWVEGGTLPAACRSPLAADPDAAGGRHSQPGRHAQQGRLRRRADRAHHHLGGSDGLTPNSTSCRPSAQADSVEMQAWRRDERGPLNPAAHHGLENRRARIWGLYRRLPEAQKSRAPGNRGRNERAARLWGREQQRANRGRVCKWPWGTSPTPLPFQSKPVYSLQALPPPAPQ